MPSVTPPSDGGSNYYKKQIEELEDEFDRQTKRSKEKEEQNQARLEEAHKSELKRKDEQHEKLLNEYKDNYDKVALTNRETNRISEEQIKKSLYDRNGKAASNETESLRTQLEAQRRASDMEKQNFSRKSAEAEQGYNQRYEEREKESGAQVEKAIQATKEAASDQVERVREQERRSSSESRQKYEDGLTEAKKESEQDKMLQRRQAQSTIAEVQRDYERRSNEADRQAQNRIDRQQRAFAIQQENQAAINEDGRARETRQLREQVKELSDNSRLYAKEKGEGRAESYREHETEYRTSKAILADSYEKLLADLKHRSAEADAYFARINDRNLKDRDAYFANFIAKQNFDHHLAERELDTEFKHNLEQVDVQRQHDMALARRNLEVQLANAADQRQNALESQAQTFQEAYTRMKSENNSHVKQLEGQIQEKSTTADPSHISPAAEMAVRKSVIDDYQKTFKAEQQRNEDEKTNIRREYKDRYDELRSTSQDRFTQAQRENTIERHLKETELLSALHDSEFMKEDSLRNQSREHDRERENLARTHASSSERQRREYDEILSSSRMDSLAKMQSMQQEAQFNAKMTHRAFTARQNELIRDYERKLADQKQDYETRLEEMKVQADSAQRDSDRKTRMSMEEQQRFYEQRLAQQEAQNKERERVMAQNFQDEMEKVKRSNALLIKKKS